MAPSHRFPALHRAAFNHPAIDNHAHPLLSAAHANDFPLTGIVSEASGAAADSISNTLVLKRATKQLAALLDLPQGTSSSGISAAPSWDDVVRKRQAMNYGELCDLCFKATKTQSILIDDGLGGVSELAEGIQWHDRFMVGGGRCFVIVRIEAEAEDLLGLMLGDYALEGREPPKGIYDDFVKAFEKLLETHAANENVKGFKSVVCYRTGLNVVPSVGSTPGANVESRDNTATAGGGGPIAEEAQRFMHDCVKTLKEKKRVRIATKAINDHLVSLTMGIAAKFEQPVQFHTGLGDNDITLTLASPAHLQPLIKAFPDTKTVLLHSSYPYTREAGYLTSVYSNVYLDFGEVFPAVSSAGQRAIITQILELTPTDKILFSTDGHWWPETYYLGNIQARKALYEVFSKSVEDGDLTQDEAVAMVENALFHNANKLYRLGLKPATT
ncbi:amidohydrolase-domain-containing protein [Schizophyllum commune]